MADSDSSHKGSVLQQYTFKFKIEGINYAAIYSYRPVSRKFHVDERRIREWEIKKYEMTAMVNEHKSSYKSQRLADDGRKPLSAEFEEILKDWIYSRHDKAFETSIGEVNYEDFSFS